MYVELTKSLYRNTDIKQGVTIHMMTFSYMSQNIYTWTSTSPRRNFAGQLAVQSTGATFIRPHVPIFYKILSSVCDFWGFRRKPNKVYRQRQN